MPSSIQPRPYRPDGPADPGAPDLSQMLPRLIVLAIVMIALLVASTGMSYVVQPGMRGIKVTLGKTADQFAPEGFGFKLPFVTKVAFVEVRQVTRPLKTDCFSSDLQQVILELRVLYKVPEQSVVQIYKQYAGDPFDSLIAPRVQEAIKEVTASQTAEQIVKNREEIKQKTLLSARQKIGNILTVEDVVIRNIDLSSELERAIEAKMVAEQQAAQAKFTQVQAQVEAETAVINAKGEAEAIRVRGEALRESPAFLRLKVVEKWNGKSPLVVPSDGNGSGASLLLPLGPSPVPVAPPAP